MTQVTFHFYDADTDSYPTVTVTQGVETTICYGGSTDEGYDHTTETYSYDGTQVILQINRESQDCDGRFDNSKTLVCHKDQLFADDADVPSLPAWVRLSSSQRDHSMNY